eukprot:CAMPEP_0172642272 /NCGR_PEP_ID=MMETSP1068-20121228/231464_1 /TAXON_ID=35684 /ORGANISM="Pseudopedinella elastica, Strain CCMP716" /LENGTH=185 /DNA_ID=CAMNT_0013456059 /DNA_START=202 /DNA_END=759 /DNA_ORIENTATION=+
MRLDNIIPPFPSIALELSVVVGLCCWVWTAQGFWRMGAGFKANAEGGQGSAGARAAVEELASKVNRMPLEEFVHTEDRAQIPLKDLRERLRNRSIDCKNMIEKSDFVAALSVHHSSTQTSCAICFDDYASARDEPNGPSFVRVLPNCHHIFHIECIDRWAFAYASTERSDTGGKSPTCPLCNAAL